MIDCPVYENSQWEIYDFWANNIKQHMKQKIVDVFINNEINKLGIDHVSVDIIKDLIWIDSHHMKNGTLVFNKSYNGGNSPCVYGFKFALRNFCYTKLSSRQLDEIRKLYLIAKTKK